MIPHEFLYGTIFLLGTIFLCCTRRKSDCFLVYTNTEVSASLNLYHFIKRSTRMGTMHLMGLKTLDRFYVILYKGDNFCDLLFGFLLTKPLLKRDRLSKEKNLLPRGAYSFLLK